MLGARVTIQMDLDRLEEWTDRNLMNFKVQSAAHENSLQCYRPGTEWLGNNSVESDPKALVDLKLNVS